MGVSPISPESIINAGSNGRRRGVECEATRMRRPRLVQTFTLPQSLAHVCAHTPEKPVVVSFLCVDRLVETVTGVKQRKQEFLLD